MYVCMYGFELYTVYTVASDSPTSFPGSFNDRGNEVADSLMTLACLTIVYVELCAYFAV